MTALAEVGRLTRDEPFFRARFKQAIEDAGLLLDYAVSQGFDVNRSHMEAIRAAEARLQDIPCTEKGWVVEFETAYRDLARRMCPVTAETLRNTTRRIPGEEPRRRSEAEKWSQTLWAIALGILVLVLGSEVLTNLGATLTKVDPFTEGDLFEEVSPFHGALPAVASFLLPFLYGALGACSYLLRSCHQTIYQRTFDTRRKSEYLNRILLGFVSGGAAGYLFKEILTGNGAVDLGAAALGFLAGYSTDFLFTTLERVVAAILPKSEPPKAGPAAPPQPKTQTEKEGS